MKNRTRERFIQWSCMVTALLLCLQPAEHAHGFINQAQSDVKQLEPGQLLERQMAGGQTHNYQIRLAAGQFMRVVVEPKGIDLSVTLTMGGKQALSVDVARSGSLESISAEAEAGGDYRLTARALGAGNLPGLTCCGWSNVRRRQRTGSGSLRNG